jgi:hypothetical protein
MQVTLSIEEYNELKGEQPTNEFAIEIIQFIGTMDDLANE